MKRTPLKRGGPLARSKTRIKQRRTGPPRRVSVTRNRDYMDWLHDRACCVCYLLLQDAVKMGTKVPRIPEWSDPAHTINNGMGSKGPDSKCVPLCREHHGEYDNGKGRKAFEAKYAINMEREADVHYAAYQMVKKGDA